jgi:hypothetical protein
MNRSRQARKRVAGFAGLGAHDIGIEEPHVGPRFERVRLREHFAFEQQAEITQPFDLEPFALALLAVLAGKAINRLDVDQRVAGTASCVAGREPMR